MEITFKNREDTVNEDRPGSGLSGREVWLCLPHLQVGGQLPAFLIPQEDRARISGPGMEKTVEISQGFLDKFPSVRS